MLSFRWKVRNVNYQEDKDVKRGRTVVNWCQLLVFFVTLSLSSLLESVLTDIAKDKYEDVRSNFSLLTKAQHIIFVQKSQNLSPISTDDTPQSMVIIDLARNLWATTKTKHLFKTSMIKKKL